MIRLTSMHVNIIPISIHWALQCYDFPVTKWEKLKTQSQLWLLPSRKDREKQGHSTPQGWGVERNWRWTKMEGKHENQTHRPPKRRRQTRKLTWLRYPVSFKNGIALSSRQTQSCVAPLNFWQAITQGQCCHKWGHVEASQRFEGGLSYTLVTQWMLDQPFLCNVFVPYALTVG